MHVIVDIERLFTLEIYTVVYIGTVCSKLFITYYLLPVIVSCQMSKQNGTSAYL